jgi:hypothetical protein
MANHLIAPYNLPVWMAIEPGGTTVGSPSCVRDASMRIKNLGEVGLLFGDELLELDDLADLLKGKNFILFVSVYSEAGGVVSTIFEAGES